MGFSMWDISVVGNLAYVAADSYVHIVDVSNPRVPALLGTYNYYSQPGSARGINVVGNLAYVAGYSDLLIIDVANPTAPSLRGIFTLPN
jgi:hypothetical protein